MVFFPTVRRCCRADTRRAAVFSKGDAMILESEILWAIDPRYSPLSLSTLKFAAARRRDPQTRPYSPTDRTDGVSVRIIDVAGTLSKYGNYAPWGTLQIGEAVREAAHDPAIHAIMLRIDSPGGATAGTSTLADEVKAAAARKPLHAFVEDLAASAAYWVASQAGRITANSGTAEVGGIGTFMALYDTSVKAKSDGVKAVVIRAGAFKGAGFPGTEITKDQLAVWQKLVDGIQTSFTQAVARGRKMRPDRAVALADGRMHIAADAQRLGLIDGIEPFDTAIRTLRDAARKRLGGRMDAAPAANVGQPLGGARFTAEQIARAEKMRAAADQLTQLDDRARVAQKVAFYRARAVERGR